MFTIHFIDCRFRFCHFCTLHYLPTKTRLHYNLVISLSGNKDHHRQSVDCQQDSKPISKAEDMLDLNLEIASCEKSSICEDKNKRKINYNYSSNNSNIMAMQMEDSGTSNSPIINNDEAADNSSNNYVNFPFVFDIFKKENEGDDNKYYNYHPAASAAAMTTVLDDKAVPITRLLFPVTGAESTTSTTAGQWLKLSCAAAVDDGQGLKAVQQKQQQVRKRRRGPRSRSSRYRGVTFYRRTSRWESHIWDCGKQVYLGAFDTAHTAARMYDLTAIKFRGVAADLNFNVTDYEEDMKQMKHLSKEEFVLTLRRQSRGFARGSSRYRGDSLHKCGRWEARMRQLVGKTYVYLGLLDNEAEAPRAYDKAASKHSGREAVINFEPSAYQREMPLDSNNGGSSNYLNLDLSLTTSQPSNTIHCEAGEMPNKEKPVEMTKEKRVQGVSSPRFTDWAWQMHRNGNVAAVPYGFSSSPTTPAANTIQLQQQINNNPAARNRFLATQNTSAAINNSHHFRNYRT